MKTIESKKVMIISDTLNATETKQSQFKMCQSNRRTDEIFFCNNFTVNYIYRLQKHITFDSFMDSKLYTSHQRICKKNHGTTVAWALKFWNAIS